MLACKKIGYFQRILKKELYLTVILSRIITLAGVLYFKFKNMAWEQQHLTDNLPVLSQCYLCKWSWKDLLTKIILVKLCEGSTSKKIWWSCPSSFFLDQNVRISASNIFHSALRSCIRFSYFKCIYEKIK